MQEGTLHSAAPHDKNTESVDTSRTGNTPLKEVEYKGPAEQPPMASLLSSLNSNERDTGTHSAAGGNPFSGINLAIPSGMEGREGRMGEKPKNKMPQPLPRPAGVITDPAMEYNGRGSE